MDILTKWFYQVNLSDFKYIMAQVFSWYQTTEKKIKQTVTKEETVLLFDDEVPENQQSMGKNTQ